MSRIVESLRHTFRHAVYRYDDLQEKGFLEGLLSDLERRLGDRAGQYEFVLYSSADNTALPDALASASPRKRVLIYISDEMSRVPRHLCDKFFAIFKCYLPSDRGLPDNLFPLPLGCTAGVADRPVRAPAERSVNVFFSGNLNRNRVPLYRELTWLRYLPCRARLLPRLMHRAGWLPRDCSRIFPASHITFTGGFQRGMSGEDYCRMLYDAKIALCPCGFVSRESFRHYEALRAGCVVISEPLPDTRFYRGSPIIVLDNWCNLRRVVQDLLREPERLQTLHHQTRKWWQDVCCEEAVARFMKDKLDLLENARSPSGEP